MKKQLLVGEEAHPTAGGLPRRAKRLSSSVSKAERYSVSKCALLAKFLKNHAVDILRKKAHH